MIQYYINHLRQLGKVGFTSREAMAFLKISRPALSMAIKRLKNKGAIVSPYRDFYVPVPPEYQKQGCIPGNTLLPPLMKHINTPYYVCLLSAALIHGATHQHPQIIQVIVSKRIRPIQCGSIHIQFIYKQNISTIPLQSFTVPSGFLKLSTPEATAMDLLLYSHQAGGLNHIATVLTELFDAIDPEKLFNLAKGSKETAWIQRLGYLIAGLDPEDLSKKNRCLELLEKLIQERKPAYIALASVKSRIYFKDPRWNLLINAKIESDL